MLAFLLENVNFIISHYYLYPFFGAGIFHQASLYWPPPLATVHHIDPHSGGDVCLFRPPVIVKCQDRFFAFFDGAFPCASCLALRSINSSDRWRLRSYPSVDPACQSQSRSRVLNLAPADTHVKNCRALNKIVDQVNNMRRASVFVSAVA